MNLRSTPASGVGADATRPGNLVMNLRSTPASGVGADATRPGNLVMNLRSTPASGVGGGRDAPRQSGYEPALHPGKRGGGGRDAPGRKNVRTVGSGAQGHFTWNHVPEKRFRFLRLLLCDLVENGNLAWPKQLDSQQKSTPVVIGERTAVREF
jgi:hypothetical protein